MAKRYHQMIPLIAECKPKVIVEVGVHKAIRAEMLCREALRHSHKVHYIGFDVFDTKGEAFQKAALNGKGTPLEQDARRKLNALANEFLNFTYELRVGDTRDTLHGGGVQADFAFIDGDHRVEAVYGDFASLVGSKVIVFDDYYKKGGKGELPDMELFGANRVVEGLMTAGREVEILPTGDVCNHGAIAHLAVVRQ